MKILIVSTYDIFGGAARAAYRLHRALIDKGVESLMPVQDKRSDDYTVIGPNSKLQKANSKFRPYIDGLPSNLYKNKTKTLFSPAWLPFSNVVKKINEINPDLVHLHWISSGMIKIEDIDKIKQPIVWSLHDMWAFTGGCHYTEGCESFTDKCGCCKVLGSKKESDLSRWIWKRKQKTYSKIKNLIIVGLSKWLASECMKSSLLGARPVVNLPNLINIERFNPLDKIMARQILNLPKDKKIISFGAVSATSDPRKGFTLLYEALLKINIPDVEIVIFGSSEPKNSPSFKQKTHYMGHLNDEISLQVLYNAVDLIVVPSIQENLSNVIMESLSCGTPVVAFDIGGNSDMIEHMQNGYLAKPFDTSDLACGIEWVLEHSDNNLLRERARNKILKEFSKDIVAERYINLYKKVISDNKT